MILFARILFYFNTFLVASLVVFGGTRFNLGFAKLELGTLEPWMALWALSYFLLKRIDPNSLNFFYSFFDKMMDSKRSKKRMISFLIFIFGTLLVARLFRHWSFMSDAFDVTFLFQALNYPFDRFGMVCDICSKGVFWAEHTALSLLLFAPFTSYLKSDEFIFFLGVMLIFLPILFLFLKGPLQKRQDLWVILCFVVVAHPFLRVPLMWDFREDMIAFAFICFALIALLKSHASYFFFLIVALLSKEHVPFITVFLIFPILFSKDVTLSSAQRKRWAVVTACISLGWAAYLFTTFIPMMTEGREQVNNIVLRFPGMGESPREIIVYLLTHPLALLSLIIQRVVRKSVLFYFLFLFGPYFFFLRKKLKLIWPWLLPGLAGAGMNLISNKKTQLDMAFHYQWALMPFFVIALLLAAKDWRPDRKAIWIPVAFALFFSQRWPMWSVWEFFPTERTVKQVRFVKNINVSGRVYADSRGLSYLSHLPKVQGISFITPAVFTAEEDSYVLFNHGSPENLKWISPVGMDSLVSVQKGPFGQYELYKVRKYNSDE